MPQKRSWTDEQLIAAVTKSKSYRAVLIALNLIPAGGNYDQVRTRIRLLSISTDHFTGQGWNKGLKFPLRYATPLEALLVKDIDIQSYKLKAKALH